jgi:hypothetical protein
MTPEEMAEELAERDYLHMSTRELLDGYTDQWQDDDSLTVALRKAWLNLSREWRRKAKENPARVTQQWLAMLGDNPTQEYDV